MHTDKRWEMKDIEGPETTRASVICTMNKLLMVNVVRTSRLQASQQDFKGTCFVLAVGSNEFSISCCQFPRHPQDLLCDASR